MMNDYDILFRHKLPILKLHGKRCLETGWPTFTFRDSLIPEDFKNLNVGINCSHGLIVVDVDPRNGGDATIDNIQRGYGKLPETWTVKTGGGGFHYYFKGRCKKFSYGGIDFQGDGSLVVCPPSIHPDTKLPYEWILSPDDCDLAECPDWVFELAPIARGIEIENSSADNVMTPQEFIDIYTEEDLKDALTYIPANDRELWLMAAMGLKWSGIRRGFELFHEWSKLGGEKYKGENDCLNTWNSVKQFGDKSTVTLRSIIHAATQRGWIYKSPYEDVFNDFIQDFEAKQKSNLDLPNNNFGRLVRWFLNTAPYPYPSFAIAASFACYSACAQGTYRTPTNRNLNLYQLLINAASSGKEHYIVNTKRILEAIKCPSLGDEPQSSQGLRRELFEYSSRISIVDEALIPLNSWAKSPNIGQAILRDILQLWSADSLNGMRTKDSSNTIPGVKNVSYSILGTGTTTHLRGLLNSPMFVELGMLSRLMIFRADIPEKLTHNFSKKTELPDQNLLDELMQICKKTSTVMLEISSGKKFKNKSGDEFEEKALIGLSVKPTISVAFNKEAEERWYSYREKMHELNLKEPREMQESGAGVVSVRNRSAEYVLRYASLLAISNDINSPIITINELAFAEALIEPMISSVKVEVDEHIFENNTDKIRKKILGYMNKCLQKGKTDVSRRELLQQCHLSKNEVDAALDDWSGVITLPAAKNGNKVIYQLNQRVTV